MSVAALTLDWDGVSSKVVRTRLRTITKKRGVGSIFYRRSATKGWHVRVDLSRPVAETTAVRLRRAWWDDRARIHFDSMRAQLPGEAERAAIGVLWDYKNDRKAGNWITWRANDDGSGQAVD